MIVGLNEYSAVGAARAVLELGLSDQIYMAGIDSSLEQIQLLEAGVYEALAIQKPFNMGYLGVGDRSPGSAGRKGGGKYRLRFGADHQGKYVHGGESEAAVPGGGVRDPACGGERAPLHRRIFSSFQT